IGASCGALWMIYLLTREWFGPGPARVSVLLFLVSPQAWFHGIVALTYIVEAFFSGLIGYLCWRAYSGEKDYLIPASAAFALAAGFRPSAALMLVPLWLLTMARSPGRRRWLAIATAVAVGVAWFFPMIAAAGGVRQYVDALAHLWSAVPARRTTLSDPWLAIGRALTIGWVFVLCFGSATALLLERFSHWPKQSDRTRFLVAWVAPGLFFFTLFFFLFVNGGFFLILSPPGFAYLAAAGHRFLTTGNRLIRWTTAAAAVAANCLVFFYAPLYCSY